MTASGNARADFEQGSLTLELRGVNSRYLDLFFRLPDELRHAEAPLRELLTARLERGKVEVRVSHARHAGAELTELDPQWLARLAGQLEAARRVIPDTAAPRLSELCNWPGQRDAGALDPQTWGAACLQAARQALEQFQQAREREGARLAAMMRECAASAAAILDGLETHLPRMLAAQREKLAGRLRESVQAAFPGGFQHIGGAELSERLAQEANLYALRVDVAEELSRLRSHLEELNHLLAGGDRARRADASNKPGGANKPGSAGKRLDFLFQEMNREANTLGSKAGSLDMTRAAMDLKLLIEQMREQAQNIE